MKRILSTIAIIISFCTVSYTQSNTASIILGYGGGDGTPPSMVYGLEYSYRATPLIEIYGKYNQFGQNDRRLDLENENILDESTSDYLSTRYNQFYSFGTGLNFHINRNDYSSFYLVAGVRYTKSNSTNVNGVRFPIIELIDIRVDHTAGLGYELGIGYRRDIKENYFLSGKLNYLNFESRVGIAFSFGARF